MDILPLKRVTTYPESSEMADIASYN